MSEHEMLTTVVAQAIGLAQATGNDPRVAAEKAAEAFKAGLAAFDKAAIAQPASSLPSSSKAASKDKSRRR